MCQRCKDSAAHYKRELRRGQPKPRLLHPCGTKAAANRHRRRGETVDLACRVAEAEHDAKYRAKNP